MAGFGIESIVNRVVKMDTDGGDPDRFLRVSVFVDESVSPAMVEHARRVLRPATSSVRLTIETYYDEAITVAAREDVLIVLANASLWTGAIASIAKSKEIPCVVVAEHLAPVIANSETTGFPIDYENIISPEVLSTSPLGLPYPLAQVVSVGTGVAEAVSNLALRDVPERLIGRSIVSGRIELGSGLQAARAESTFEKLFEEVGSWVMRNCDDAAAPFARAFEFSRPARAGQVARRTAFENAVSGAIFFIPGADFPVMTLNELRMLLKVEQAYGHSVDKQTLIEAAAVVCFGFACKLMAKGACKSFPMLTWFIKTGVAYCATLALGLAVRRYCENGRVLPSVVVSQIRRFAPKLLPDQLRVE